MWLKSLYFESNTCTALSVVYSHNIGPSISVSSVMVHSTLTPSAYIKYLPTQNTHQEHMHISDLLYPSKIWQMCKSLNDSTATHLQ